MTTNHAKKIRIALGAAVLGACALSSAQAATNVYVQVGQPAYGRIAIAEPVPQAAWVNQQPVIIQQQPVAIQRQPIYLYVPPAHSNNWARYCGRYNACGQPVIFVQDRWVRDHQPVRHGHGNGRGDRDRDRDGSSNRHDSDRDGDGVPNSRDQRPNDPRRY